MNSEVILHEPVSQCPNCESAVSGHFCHQCGQETKLHVPSAGEFLHEFVGHYVALEGKLWKSLALLLFRPGRLTLEYLQGRRARYVLPLRLYLTFSLIFFVLFKLSGNGHGNDQAGHESAKLRAEIHAQADDKSREADGRTDGEFRNLLAKVHPKLAEKATKFTDLSDKEQQHQLVAAFFGYAPYAVFCMMPLFAAYLKLLYLGSGRRYGEHLLFALHTNAFAFLMLTLLLVTPSFIPYVHGLLGLWLVFYLPAAMRRVYGGSRRMTALRWIVLMALHGISIGMALVAALLMAILV
ncbi:DUF3667 domain-containing protein [Massilia horti]|uniref:DUF3667 domain-containing protein n=1 Tax=Massilia horti TaxID=2562153 RepID=A0A4Y9SN48_9BURK|nr:DUF3667 domain-containing protein [Massilia horti]TFW28112.1 DUF3667 domain-containing protein [Massilia horti]TFW28133.1 DUF3667 domain-containing protein [Massilia horti]